MWKWSMVGNNQISSIGMRGNKYVSHRVKQRPWFMGRAGRGPTQDIWLASPVVSYRVIILTHSWARTASQINILLKERNECWFYSCQVHRQMTLFSLWIARGDAVLLNEPPFLFFWEHGQITPIHVHTQLVKVIQSPINLPPDAYILYIPPFFPTAHWV